MNKGFYQLAICLLLFIYYQLKTFFLLAISLLLLIGYCITVIQVYYCSFNSPAYSQLQLDYQSIGFSISNCQLLFVNRQLLIGCYMLYVNCYNPIKSNCNSIAIEQLVDRPQEIDHQAQSPPATIFFAKSYIEISVSKAIRKFEHKDICYIDKTLYHIPGTVSLDRSVPYMNRRLDIKTICYKDHLLYGKKLKNFYRKI
jgi:hypothetical protein